MADGFLSRFLIVEYDGDRPPINYNPVNFMSVDVANHLATLVGAAVDRSHGCQLLSAADAAVEAMHAFNLECDMQINSTRTNEPHRQMWNRAHLKMMRLAALVAIPDNPAFPRIEIHHVQWALQAIRNDIAIMTRRLNEGDVGISDHSREQKLQTYFSDYLTQEVPDSYNVPKALKANGIIPRKYLQIRSQKTPSFVQHPLGAIRALDEALRNMVDSGYLGEISKDKLASEYGFSGKAYRILELSKAYRKH